MEDEGASECLSGSSSFWCSSSNSRDRDATCSTIHGGDVEFGWDPEDGAEAVGAEVAVGAAAAEAAHFPVAGEVLAAAAPEESGEPMSLFTLLPKVDHARVVAAIGAAESKTSGEIRVLVSRQPALDPVAIAQREFERLGMTNTAARNGVLIFLAPKSRTFAVIGDTAIHEKCGDSFWRILAGTMESHFKRGEFTDGLVHAIDRAGSLLAEHFPRSPDDKNELPDAIEEM